MKRILTTALLCGLLGAGIATAPAYAACGSATALAHFESYLLCNDYFDDRAGGRIPQRVTAFAYGVATPAGDNSGPQKIACETNTESGCNPFLPSGSPTDGQVTIESDWFISSYVGCPILDSPPRVAVHVQGADGREVVLSVSLDLTGGYTLDFAHPADQDGLVQPVACDDVAKTSVRNLVVANNNASFNVLFSQPRLYSDCDAGSYGKFLDDLGGYGSCGQGNTYVPVRGFGGVFYSHQPCDQRLVTLIPGTAPNNWLPANTTPNAAIGGLDAVVPLPLTAGLCAYVGTQITLDGATSSGASGAVRLAGNSAASDRAIEVRAAQAQGKVKVTFQTASELEAVSFDIVANGRVVNGSPIAAKGGNGIGASYEIVLKNGDFRGAKSLSVRTNLRSGGSITTDPVSF